MLKIPMKNRRVVLEIDGTVIDENKALNEMDGQELMILSPNEIWIPPDSEADTSMNSLSETPIPPGSNATGTVSDNHPVCKAYVNEVLEAIVDARFLNLAESVNVKTFCPLNLSPQSLATPAESGTIQKIAESVNVKTFSPLNLSPQSLTTPAESGTIQKIYITKESDDDSWHEVMTSPIAISPESGLQTYSEKGSIAFETTQEDSEKFRSFDQSVTTTLSDSEYVDAEESLENNETNDANDNTIAKVSLKSVMGKLPATISQMEYYRICHLLSMPQLENCELDGFVEKVLSYLMQRVKMRGCRVLHATRIAGLVRSEEQVYQRVDKFNPRPAASSSTESAQLSPVSRLDCLTGLFNSVDEIVACDLLAVMSQFPMALPLVIRCLNTGKYLLMSNLLRGVTFKWENGSGKIIDHSLFNKPFRMIVAVRLGTNAVGKSTILNQLLTNENTFSSKAEPGSEYGKPASLDGSVEFVSLTQETCKDALWRIMSEFYSADNQNEVALLANLHGDATDFPWLLELLMRQFSCHFMTFVLPNCSEDKWNELLRIVKKVDRVTAVYVDRKSYNPRDPSEIQTRELTADVTLRKVRSAVGQAISSCKSQTTMNNQHIDLFGDHITVAPELKTTTSDKLVKFVERKNCVTVKQSMEMQIKRLNKDDKKLVNRKNGQLNLVLQKFADIFQLQKEDIMRSVIHLEKELSRLSNGESQSARAHLCQRKTELQKVLAKPNSNKDEIKRLQVLVNEALNELDKHNLGMEHFVREIAQYYECSLVSKENEALLRLPDTIADLFLTGYPLELLDGDAEDIPMLWFNAVCKRINHEFPKLRVYVVSIIGLQSSGKSTLLNSLFACRFAVSVGRCSRGLFMRLLFLDSKLVKALKCDAILLIDTEGLGSPEKMNDAEAEKKDRLQAAFAMGISNLTIINVLGEYIKELTEILQIAIVTMARLEQAEISPDILMVQHLLTEKNSDRTLESQSQFCEAIHKAVELAEKKEVQVGIRNAKCLSVLFQRVQDGTLLTQFHPYKDGATANSPPSEAYHKDVLGLHGKILDSCKSSSTIITFKKWQALVESYWGCVTKEDFSLRFKNIKEIYDFIERGKRIETVKQALSAAFSSHSNYLRATFASLLSDTLSSADGQRKTKIKILDMIQNDLMCVPSNCMQKCEVCIEAVQHVNSLFSDIEGQECELDVKKTISDYESRIRQSQTAKLSQKLEALIVGQGCSADFDNIINTQLKCILTDRGNKKFSPKEQRQIADRILQMLKESVSVQTQELTVKQKILNEIALVYHAMPGMVGKVRDPLVFSAIVNLKEPSWFVKLFKGVQNMFSTKRQSQNNIVGLENDLIKLPSQIVEETNADCYEEGMVARLAHAVENLIDIFCTQNPALNSDVRTRLHIFAQQQFCIHMEQIQDQWDRKNKPSKILEADKERYRQLIDVRLRNGFTCVSEGEIMVQRLLEEITRKAVVAENSERVRAVLGLVWTTNSEHVRLKYFKMLAEEVRNGEKVRALRHFCSPKREIETWYRSQLDSFRQSDYGTVFSKTFDGEFQHVLRNVSFSPDINGLISVVQTYLHESMNGFYSPQADMSDLRTNDFDNLKETMLKSLSDSKEKAIKSIEPSSFLSPTSDPEVMTRLGCTRQCYWCGALCWGQRGHDQNADETKKHHASHQPSGLIGVHCRRSKILLAEPCHEYEDDGYVCFGEFDADDSPGILWKLAKQEHFNDWKFDRHYITKYDELMRWFFQELHLDISSQSSGELLPATDEDLDRYCCTGLNVDEILCRIDQEIE